MTSEPLAELRPLQDVVNAIGTGWLRGSCEMIEPRDMYRLMKFASLDLMKKHCKPDATPWDTKEWTLESIGEQIRKDLDFAYEKAEGQRGISADLMSEVIQMWAYALGWDDLALSEDYAPYGLPILRQFKERFEAIEVLL